MEETLIHRTERPLQRIAENGDTTDERSGREMRFFWRQMRFMRAPVAAVEPVREEAQHVVEMAPLADHVVGNHHEHHELRMQNWRHRVLQAVGRDNVPHGDLLPDTDATPREMLLGYKMWEVTAPPPVNTFKGAVAPSPILAVLSRNRRISLEIHRVPIINEIESPKKMTKKKKTEQEARGEGVDYYDECIVRILYPEGMFSGTALWRGRRAHGNDEETTTMMGSSSDIDDSGSPQIAGWRCKYRVPIRNFTAKAVDGNTVPCIMQVQAHKQTRSFIFNSEEEAWEFSKYVEFQTLMEEQRAPIRLKAQLGATKSELEEELTLLVEIVSAWNLPRPPGQVRMDPYVTCYFNGKEVHRTGHIDNNYDPIWTVRSGSLFLLNCTVRELFSCGGLVCELKDFAAFGKNDQIGAIIVPSHALYAGTGERLEFDLGKAQGQEFHYGQGKMATRCRHASEYDKKFMRSLANKEFEFLGISKDIQKAIKPKGGKGYVQSLSTRYKRTVGFGSHRREEYKVRPGPDPDRPRETKWLTQQALADEVQKESFNWIDTGSGPVGRLFVEILGCDELPNRDSFGSKTDAFVVLVFEDSATQTDIIDDSLAPRWPPWSKRGFIFHFLHPSSNLYLGVFDYDPVLEPEFIGQADSNFIGRVAVDLSNLRPDTVYTLTYDIFPTARTMTRVRTGSITVRLRLDVMDERKLMLTVLRPPPEFYVNVKNRQELQMMRLTVWGTEDMDSFSTKVIRAYIEELLAYRQFLNTAKEAVLALLFWKGHYPIKIIGRTIRIPLNSLVAFGIGVTLAERPSKIPSILCACVSWFMFFTLDKRRHYIPNPWYNCKSLVELSQTLATGKPTPTQSIEAFERAEEAKAFKEWHEQKAREAEEEAKRTSEEMARRREQELKELEEAGGDTDISTKKEQKSWLSPTKYVNPSTYNLQPTNLLLKPYLYPVQENLAAVCKSIRVGVYVATWTECYLAYWITLVFLVLSIMFYFVPWSFVFKWLFRLAAWAVLGPWMKLVDIYYVQRRKNRSDEEKQKQREKADQKRRKRHEKTVYEARVKRENAEKLKDMKTTLFGEYIGYVPVFKQDMYRDVPRPESSAVPYRPESKDLSELVTRARGRQIRLPGQYLVGDMIPRAYNRSLEDWSSYHIRDIIASHMPARYDYLLDYYDYVKIGVLIFLGFIVCSMAYSLAWPLIRVSWRMVVVR